MNKTRTKKSKIKRYRNRDIERALMKMKSSGAISHFSYYAEGECWEVDANGWKVSPLYIELQEVNKVVSGDLVERVVNALYMDVEKHREECDNQIDKLAEKLGLM